MKSSITNAYLVSAAVLLASCGSNGSAQNASASSQKIVDVPVQQRLEDACSYAADVSLYHLRRAENSNFYDHINAESAASLAQSNLYLLMECNSDNPNRLAKSLRLKYYDRILAP